VRAVPTIPTPFCLRTVRCFLVVTAFSALFIMYRSVLLFSSLQTLRLLFVHEKLMLCVTEVASEAMTTRVLQWVDCNNVTPKHAVRLPHTRRNWAHIRTYTSAMASALTKICSEGTTISVEWEEVMATLLAVSKGDEYEISHGPSTQCDSPTKNVVPRWLL
jgi:hypothetical protein